jgi:predicted dehydrogenase
MLRGAISGFGEVAARAHLAGWATRDDVRIVAIHDPVSSRRHAAINLIKNVRVYDDLELMLDAERLDFVDIASPPAYHSATAIRALEAGAHVLIEKPLCLERAVFADLKRAAAQASRVLMCVHNWKYAPAYRRAHELIAAGRLGDVTHLTLNRLRTGPAGPSQPATDTPGTGDRWRVDAHLGGGILIDHGWHVFYLMQWLLAGSCPTAVAAELGYLPGTNVDDFANLSIEFDTRTARALLSWRAPKRSTTARIEGTEAVLEVDGNRLALQLLTGNHEDWSVTDIADDSYHPSWFAGLAADFVVALEQGYGGALMAANLAEAASAIELIAGARLSAQDGGALINLATPTG